MTAAPQLQEQRSDATWNWLTLRTVRMVIAAVVILAAILHALYFTDAFTVMAITPFLLLGCARGKHPLTLSALAVVPGLCFILASHVKIAMTGTALMVFDQFFVRENLLALAYNDYRVAIAVTAFLAGTLYYFRTLLRGQGSFTPFEKGAAASGITASVACLFSLPPASSIDFWDLSDNVTQPTIRTLAVSMRHPDPRLRLGLDSEPRVVLGSRPMQPPGERPDLFFILQESTFDPAMIKPGYKPKTLFAEGLQHTGRLHVHTYGGGTWLSEFTLTTQVRPQEFGGGGHYVFFQLPGHIQRSIFTVLKDLGYRTVVVYATDRNFINAETFYRSIGVDEFHDPVSLGIGNAWNWRLQDSTLYDAVLDKSLRTDGRPVAVLMQTIYQHGPHDPADPVADYIARFEQSDLAYEKFLNALAARGLPSGVVAFGDHQPDFTQSLIPSEKAREVTNYEIRCVNFDCASPKLQPGRAPQLDLTLLAPVALEEFGFVLDDLSLYQRTLFRDCADDVSACGDDLLIRFNQAFSPFFKE